MRIRPALLSTTLACGLLAALPAAAVTLLPTDQGHMSAVSSLIGTIVQHDPGNTDLKVAGSNTGPISSSVRSYLLFDMPAGLGAVASATLRLTATVPEVPLVGGHLSFHDITSPVAEFAVGYVNSSTLQARTLYGDLATGASYGSTSTPNGTHPVVMVLPAQGLLDLQAARGGVFGIGITGSAFLSLPVVLSDVSLDITPVPEPATSALLLAGLATLAWRRRGRPA